MCSLHGVFISRSIPRIANAARAGHGRGPYAACSSVAAHPDLSMRHGPGMAAAPTRRVHQSEHPQNCQCGTGRAWPRPLRGAVHDSKCSQNCACRCYDRTIKAKTDPAFGSASTLKRRVVCNFRDWQAAPVPGTAAPGRPGVRVRRLPGRPVGRRGGPAGGRGGRRDSGGGG